jgi:ubiquinone/menaquinone biosynthesis C-methylase UbiE
VYDENVAEVYDLIYVAASGKDYTAEAGEVADLIRERAPHASSLLDVACGTGMHLLRFRELFDHVEGVELSAGMLAVAAGRLPGVALHRGDMRTFRLGRTFSAVTCLFSAIGYVQSRAELYQALERFAAHLDPGGVVVVEPWFTPEQWRPGTVHHGFAQDDGRVVARVSYSDVDGSRSVTRMHYLLGEEGAGVRHWEDVHLMSLFSGDTYREAFERAGFTGVAWLPGWREGRERIVAVLPG